MGSDLEASRDNGGTGADEQSAPKSYDKLFDEMCPYYMSMGMSLAEYWDGDPIYVKFYREAHELKKEEKNRELWLQGMYFYDALVDVAPLIKAFAKNPKLTPYPSEPYALTKKEKEEKEKREMLKMKADMEAWMLRVNKAM